MYSTYFLMEYQANCYAKTLTLDLYLSLELQVMLVQRFCVMTVQNKSKKVCTERGRPKA